MKRLFKRGICAVICVLMLALTMTAGILMMQKPETVHAKVTVSEKRRYRHIWMNIASDIWNIAAMWIKPERNSRLTAKRRRTWY